MAPPGNYVVVHDKTNNCILWGNHGTLGWYIGPSLDHYRFIKCYMLETGIVCITDTLKHIPKYFAFLKTTTEDYL